MIKIDFRRLNNLDRGLLWDNWKHHSEKREETRILINSIKLYPVTKKYFNELKGLEINNLEFKDMEINDLVILEYELEQFEKFLKKLSSTKASYENFFNRFTKDEIIRIRKDFNDIAFRLKTIIERVLKIEGLENNNIKKFLYIYDFRLIGIITLKEFREKITEFEKYELEDQIQELEELKGKNVKMFGQFVKLDTKQEIENSDSVDTVKSLELVKNNYIEDFINFNNCNIFNIILKNNIKNNNDMLEHLKKSNNIEMIFSENSYNTNGYFNNNILIKTYKLSDELIQELDIIDEYITVIYAHRYGDIRSNYTEPIILSHLEQDDILYILSSYSKDIYFNINEKKYLAVFKGFSDEVLIYTVLENGLLEGFGVYYGDIEDIKQYVIDNL